MTNEKGGLCGYGVMNWVIQATAIVKLWSNSHFLVACQIDQIIFFVTSVNKAPLFGGVNFFDRCLRNMLIYVHRADELSML